MHDTKIPPENNTFKTRYPVTLWTRLRPASAICDGISYQVPAGTVATLIRQGEQREMAGDQTQRVSGFGMEGERQAMTTPHKNPAAVALGRLGGKAGRGASKRRTKAQCAAAGRASAAARRLTSETKALTGKPPADKIPE